jgi:PAS domain-containing protein
MMQSFEEVMNPLTIAPAVSLRAVTLGTIGEVRRTTVLLTMLLASVCLFAITSNADAQLYKWTDDRGIIHYSDQMPADAVNRANLQLSRQGLTVRKTEQARPSTQPTATSEADEQRARQAEREKLLATRRDRALIESYANEKEIDFAKARAVGTIDGQVQSAQAYIAQMQKRRNELEAKKATYAPRPVPGALVLEVETIDAEVARQREFIAAKQKESATVAARYDADKQRFHELRSGEPSGVVVATDDGRYSSADPAATKLTRTSGVTR